MANTVENTENLSDDELPLPELETNLIALGSDIAAAEARWLMMLAVFDRRGGWTGTGVVSCAHWLSWRLGFSLIAAREKVRVARALGDLPTTSAAFEKGELSYSRARAITRVATPENEGELVDLARHSTGAQLERVVRAMSGVVKAEEVKERAYRRHVSWHWDEDGSLLLSARFDPVEGAAVINAIEAAQAADQKPAAAKPAVDAVEPAPADVAEGTHSTSSAEPAAANLAEATDPPQQVEPAEQAGQTEPVDATEPLETTEHPHGDFAEAARESRVDAFVRVAESYIASTGAASGADVYQVVVHVGPEGASHVEDGPALSNETVLRLSCDASLYCVHEDADGNVLDVGRRTRSIPPAIRRALRQRDAGCRFPGCGRRRRVDGHHVRTWTRDRGPTSVANLVLLCPRHHTLVHEGGFGVTMVKGQPVFTRPDGSVIPEGPASPPATKVPRQWHRADVRPTAVDSQWSGEPLDLGYVVAGLVRDRSNEGPARVSPHHDGSEGTR